MTQTSTSRRSSGTSLSASRAALLATALCLACIGPPLSSAQRPAGNGASVNASTANTKSNPRSKSTVGTPDIPPPQPHLRSHIGLNLGLGGRWWDETSTVKQLKISPWQQSRMDAIFETNKPTLIRLYLRMQSEQARLAALPPSELQNVAKVFTAIDRVSSARCDLEKENARILIEIRQQLDSEQLQILDREIASLQ